MNATLMRELFLRDASFLAQLPEDTAEGDVGSAGFLCHAWRIPGVTLLVYRL